MLRHERVDAVRAVASVFGVLAGLLGAEYGWYELQRGNTAPIGVLISAIGPPCEPSTTWHACEPALTFLPSYLASGRLSILLALGCLVWSVFFVRRGVGAMVLLALTVALLLCGGGFVTFFVGLMAALAAATINARHRWWRSHVSRGMTRVLAGLWPAIMIAYLVWFVGSSIVNTCRSSTMVHPPTVCFPSVS